MGKLGLGWMFLLIFGGGACYIDSQVFLFQVELYCPCQGARLSNLLWFALSGFCSLKAFPAALEDKNENGSLLISSLEPNALGPTPQCGLRGKQSLPSPWSPATLHAHRASEPAFLTQAYDPVWSLQTHQTPAVGSRAVPPEVGRGFCPVQLVGPWLEKQWTDCAPDPGLWQP